MRKNKKTARQPHKQGISSGKNVAPDGQNSVRGGKRHVYRDVRALVDSIFRARDPVETASKLLEGKDACKVWLQLLDYRYGKPVQQIEAKDSEGMKFNFITLAPRPERGIREGAAQEEET